MLLNGRFDAPAGIPIFLVPRPGRIVAVARDEAFPGFRTWRSGFAGAQSNLNARAMILTRRSLGGRPPGPARASGIGALQKHQNSPIYSRLKEVYLGEPIEFSIGGRET